MGKRGVMPITSSTLKNSEGRAMCRGQSLAGRQDESRTSGEDVTVEGISSSLCSLSRQLCVCFRD